MIGASIAQAGLGLLSAHSASQNAKKTLAANTDIANKTLAQQQAEFGKVEAGAQPYLGLGADATANLRDPANAFQHSPGYNFAIKEGTQNTLGATALNGLLRSGSAAKALGSYVTGTAQQDYNNWTNQQQGNANIGLGGLGSLSSAASGNANALNGNLNAITNANNANSADQNSAANTGYNAISGALGGFGATPGVNNMFASYLAKLKTPASASGSSSYGPQLT